MPETNFFPVPKPPKNKKKKVLSNGYKGKPQRKCYYTGTLGAERHEVYGGANRQTSIEYKFQVDLCEEIHRAFHNPRTQEDIDRITYWKKKHQKDFEKKLIEGGMLPSSARSFFITLIGASYLEPLGE